MTKRPETATESVRDRPAIEITPAMIEAGVDAFFSAYDREADGLDNITQTVRLILQSALSCCR